MPRSFLNTQQSSGAQAADSSAFLAGLHIGATTQGNYEANLAAEQAAEVDAQHKMQLQSLKEQGDTFRRSMENMKDLAKVGFEKNIGELGDQETANQAILNDNSGKYSQVQRDTAAANINTIRGKKELLLKSFSQIDPNATQYSLPVPGNNYDAGAFAAPTQQFAKAVEGKNAEAVAKGEEEGMKAKGQKQFMNKFGFPNVTEALEYATGQPLSLISQGRAESFKAGQPSKSQAKEENDLELQAPGALGQYLNYVNNDAAWQANLKSDPLKPRSQFEAPDTRELQYHAHVARGKDVVEKFTPIYQKNFQLQLKKNPALQSVYNEISSTPDKAGIDWTHPSTAPGLAKILAKRIGDAAQAGDQSAFTGLKDAYSKLGLMQLGSPESFYNNTSTPAAATGQ